jgi:hypothetical protein
LSNSFIYFVFSITDAVKTTKTRIIIINATYITVRPTGIHKYNPASGIVSTSGYAPAPAFSFGVFAGAQERSANANNTDVLVYHGSTDAPAVNVLAVGSGTIVSNLSYGNFNSTTYLPLPSSTSAGNYTLHVTNTAGTTTVATYGAPLNTLGTSGLAISVLASGFLNPAVNSTGPAFGLYVALPAGGPLVPLPQLNTTATGIANITSESIGVSVFPNPITDRVVITNSEELELTYSVSDYTGKVFKQGEFSTGVESLDVNELQSGLYLLKVNSTKGQTTIKLVK